jgi:hypothetical protein
MGMGMGMGMTARRNGSRDELMIDSTGIVLGNEFVQSERRLGKKE